MISRSHLRLALVALAALGLSAAPSPAGELAAQVQAGYFGLTASESADAVFGTSGGLTWGGAARFSFDLGVYVTAGVRTFSKEGERVFVAGRGDPVARLGFPLSMRITPIFATVGYRFRQGHLIVPYAGLGGSINLFREESDVAGLAYEESTSKAGFHVAGGAEIGRGRFRFGTEVGWSTVPSAVGVAGVSKVYGEDNVGGWSVVGKLVIAFGGKKDAKDAESETESDEETSESEPEPDTESGDQPSDSEPPSEPQ
ncbi:MAG: hypothetical protein LJF15_12210 [Acidobacteria bacterium]|jgi:hypothetical protein|nr:hypothetical protein [Acidobacteriota bacterium]